ncbi:hypothetical protein [Halomonas sp. JS92-SW72]|uniref:hypothetical protein n=1 Tax=Halomonas sp. JS92-SW72 TaxID=2306583 RepID=UPI0013C2B100|nr:hypothetical protein [Halomonas sp. JS92-SW72]
MTRDERERIEWGWMPRNASMYAIARAARAAGLRYGRSRRFKGKPLLVSDATTRVYFGRGGCSLSSRRKLRIAKSKSRTRRFLERHGCNTITGKRFLPSQASAAVRYARRLGFPVILKPDDGSKGRGVEKLHDAEGVARYLSRLSDDRQGVVVETFFAAQEYRITAVNGQLLGVANRVPANVTGDGASTIHELIAAKNAIRSRRRACPPIVVDPVVTAVLGRQGLSLASIVDKDVRITLRDSTNVSLGGESVDMTEAIHPGYLKALEGAARAFSDIVMVGFDVFIEDIRRPPDDTNWAVLEVNGSPMISLHHFPWEGEERDIAGAALRELFPDPHFCSR